MAGTRWFGSSTCRVLALIAGSLFAIAALAEGFDRSKEIERYSQVFTSSTDPVAITAAAKELTLSGIADPDLAVKVKDRLVSDFPTRSHGSRNDLQSVLWMVNALASFGIAEYADTLNKIAQTTDVKRLRKECEEQVATIEWNHRKNEIMAQSEGYPADIDMRTAMLINLIKSDDFRAKKLGASRASLEKRTDPILMDTVSEQIDAYVGSSGHTDETDDTIKYFIRLLGYSSDPKHRAVLEKVSQSQLSSGVPKFAKQILAKHT